MSYISEKANVYDTAEIGEDVSIGAFAEVGNKVKIGNSVKISCGVFIPENVVIQDNVFIGPHVVFTNDKYPPSNGAWRDEFPTIVYAGVSIGANSTILPGLQIEGSVGAGAVVTKNVPEGAVVYGNPAKDPYLEADIMYEKTISGLNRNKNLEENVSKPQHKLNLPKLKKVIQE